MPNLSPPPPVNSHRHLRFDRQVETYLLRGLVLSGAGRYGEAIAFYQQAITSYPQLAALVQPYIAHAYEALGDSSNAAVAYRAAVDASSDTVQTRCAC